MPDKLKKPKVNSVKKKSKKSEDDFFDDLAWNVMGHLNAAIHLYEKLNNDIHETASNIRKHRRRIILWCAVGIFFVLAGVEVESSIPTFSILGLSLKGIDTIDVIFAFLVWLFLINTMLIWTKIKYESYTSERIISTAFSDIDMKEMSESGMGFDFVHKPEADIELHIMKLKKQLEVIKEFSALEHSSPVKGEDFGKNLKLQMFKSLHEVQALSGDFFSKAVVNRMHEAEDMAFNFIIKIILPIALFLISVYLVDYLYQNDLVIYFFHNFPFIGNKFIFSAILLWSVFFVMLAIYQLLPLYIIKFIFSKMDDLLKMN